VLKACNLDGVEWELGHHFNREAHVGLGAGEGVPIVGKHVRGAGYASYGAVLDVKLFVAEAFVSAVTEEVIMMVFQDKMGKSAGGCVMLTSLSG
jgi:hypothetical protein